MDETKPRLSGAEIARHWGCTRQHAGHCIKKGCPTTSLAAADSWRLANSRYGVGYRSKGVPEVNLNAKGKVNLPANLAHGDSQTPTLEPIAAIPNSGEAVCVETHEELSSMEQSLCAAIAVEEAAYRLVKDAQRLMNDEKLVIRTAAYNKAQMGRLQAEEMILKIKERRKVLVPMETAKSIMRRMFVPHLGSLDSFGRANASRIRNAESDAGAVMVCDEAMDRVKADVHRLYELAVA